MLYYPAPMKIIACIEYDGTHYCGWQRLSHAPSIQEEVEKALSSIANHPVEVVCAGRTDSGVHAIGQVIHFETEAQRLLKAWVLGTNTLLPDDIAVIWAQEASEVEADAGFSARFSAYLRRYRYVILNRRARPALLANKVGWVFEPLDEYAMHEAAQLLLGEHDFSSFRASGCQAKHANRELVAIEVSREGDFIYVDIAANAFLHHMVRNIVGTLIEIGKGEWPINFMAELLSLKDRKKAGPTAPPGGLYFVHVHYPEIYQLPDDYHLPGF